MKVGRDCSRRLHCKPRLILIGADARRKGTVTAARLLPGSPAIGIKCHGRNVGPPTRTYCGSLATYGTTAPISTFLFLILGSARSRAGPAITSRPTGDPPRAGAYRSRLYGGQPFAHEAVQHRVRKAVSQHVRQGAPEREARKG
jgi:hypothetical protein